MLKTFQQLADEQQADQLQHETRAQAAGFGDILAAEFEQNNLVVAGVKFLIKPLSKSLSVKPDPVEGYNIFKDPQFDGRRYVDYIPDLAWSSSPTETRQMMNQINRERFNQRVLSEAGGRGVAASMLSGFVSFAVIGTITMTLALMASTNLRQKIATIKFKIKNRMIKGIKDVITGIGSFLVIAVMLIVPLIWPLTCLAIGIWILQYLGCV